MLFLCKQIACLNLSNSIDIADGTWMVWLYSINFYVGTKIWIRTRLYQESERLSRSLFEEYYSLSFFNYLFYSFILTRTNLCCLLFVRQLLEAISTTHGACLFHSGFHKKTSRMNMRRMLFLLLRRRMLLLSLWRWMLCLSFWRRMLYLSLQRRMLCLSL